MQNIINRPFLHKNFTLKKLIYFAIVSGIGTAIITGGTWLLTDKMGVYYVLSTLITGALAFVIKYIITAIWVFNDK